jgi:hypothetical protein
MEYSYADVERKFRESLIKAKLRTAYHPDPIEKFFYVHGMEVDENDTTKILAHECPIKSDPKWYYMSTHVHLTNKYPNLEPVYWNPDNGIYHGIEEGKVFLVLRKLRRTFCVGLNHNSYAIQQYRDGRIAEGNTAAVVDPTKPRLFNSADILTEKIYRVNTSLFFNNQRIGLIEENHIYLSDPDYLHFLPERVRGLCCPNH